MSVEYSDAQSWDAFFRNVSNDAAPGLAHASASRAHTATVQQVSQAASGVSSKLIDDHLALQAITRAYQVGQMKACSLTSRFTYAILVFRCGHHCNP